MTCVLDWGLTKKKSEEVNLTISPHNINCFTSISMRILLSQICSLGFAATVSYGSRQCLALFSVLCYARRKRLEAKKLLYDLDLV